MTDETTARDRAIEGLARRIESQALISDRPGQLDELEQIAREVRALAGAPTADVAAERVTQAVMQELAGFRRSIAADDRSTRLVRAIDEVEGNHDALIMVRAGDVINLIAEIKELTPRPREIPAADVAEVPTLDRDGYDEEFVLRAARTFADGGQVGHPPTVVAELLAMIARRDALLAAAPEGVDAADEQEPCLSRGCTAPRGHTDDHESADGDTWDNSIDDPGADGADLEAQGEMADQLAAAQAAIQRVREKHNRYADGSCWECGKDHPCPSVRALDGDTTKEA